MDLKNLFSTKKTDSAPTVTNQPNEESRRTGETYQQWGIRMCGRVSGNLMALAPCLQRVFNDIYNEQTKNTVLQEAKRNQIQADIEQRNNEIAAINNKIGQAKANIDEYKASIGELKDKQKEIEQKKEEINKEQRIKLYIALIILVPLTFYLFLFYSSTFYSAFFRDPTSLTNAMNAMFDSNALVNAYKGGITQLGFVLIAPIIFLGLGFVLHFFSVQKNKTKYLKMGAILLVTIMFDCILAYKIGDQMHTFGIIIGQYPIGQEYTVSMAFHDINTWAVIFCGFIVYVIWGIVFDMGMTAYNNMDLNKVELNNIKDKIDGLEQKIQDEKNTIQSLNQQKTSIEGQITNLKSQLNNKVFVDYAAIKTEMNNFYVGWIQAMPMFVPNKAEQQKAQQIYEQTIAGLIPN